MILIFVVNSTMYNLGIVLFCLQKNANYYYSFFQCKPNGSHLIHINFKMRHENKNKRGIKQIYDIEAKK